MTLLTRTRSRGNTKELEMKRENTKYSIGGTETDAQLAVVNEAQGREGAVVVSAARNNEAVLGEVESMHHHRRKAHASPQSRKK